MERFERAVIGSGSGNVVVAGDRVALVEGGAFGGTCINRGCIPSKMLVYTADLAHAVQRARQFGVHASLDGVDWPAIRDRVFARVDQTSSAGRQGREASDNVSVYSGWARFAGPHELVINDDTHILADQVVIATGGRPAIPSVVERSNVDFETSDTIMRLDSLPSSMLILGGGPVAVEFAHIFCSLGVKIDIVTASPTLMETLDADISRRFTAHALSRWNVHLNANVSSVRGNGAGVELELEDGTKLGGGLLLVATGRKPNTDNLGLELAGVSVGKDRRIVVDEFGRAAPGVWALGDCSSPFELKHVANAEARTIAHNLAHPDDLRRLPHDWVPSAVFTDPQVATVGARSQDLHDRAYLEATQEFGDTAYGWAMQDTIGVCRLYADPATGTLLGAHIMGEQASLLIAPLIQAAAHGQNLAALARDQYWIHPTLSEVLENALLKLSSEH